MSVYKTPAFVQSKLATGSGSSASVTLDAASTAGNALVLAVCWQDNVSISEAVSGGGNVWESASDRQGAGPYLQIWHATGALATTTVTVTFSASASWTLALHEYSNVAKIGALAAEESGSDTGITELGTGAISITEPAMLFAAFSANNVVNEVFSSGLANSRITDDFAWTTDTLSVGAGAHSATASWETMADAVGQIIALTAELAGTALDDHHYWRLDIGGTDYSAYVRGVITVTQPLGGEIGTMRFAMMAKGSGLTVTSWQECRLYVDTLASAYFGGFILNVTPAIDQDQPDGWATYDVLVEEWATALNRTPPVSRRYTSATDPGDIVADLFNYALDPSGSPPAQTEFDVTTYVSAGSWGAGGQSFLVDNEQITEALDRLALAVGFDWWIDGDKKVHFGNLVGTNASFGIAGVEYCNYTTSFPPLSKPAVRRDGSDIRNRVTVYGGVQVLKQEDILAGDGSTLLFQLSRFPVIDVVLITVDGVLQSWGTDWYHSFDDYDVLVDYSCGTIRWNTGSAPANGAVIVVGYYYGAQVAETAYNTSPPTSYSIYGRWFDYEIVDRSITNAAMAQAIAQAVVDEYEWEAVDGKLQVERLGIKPGNNLAVNITALGLSGGYPVRQVTTELGRGGIARCEITFGGRRRLLGVTLEGTTQAGPLGKSTTWQERLLMASLHPVASKAQGELMRSIGLTETDQLAANTNYLGGAQTAYRWPVYTKAGALAGYVPLYSAGSWGASGGPYLLASGATTGASSQAQTFTNGIIGPTWKPASDSTTALQVQQAGGTAVVTVDTTNSRVGIGATPTYKLHVAGDINTTTFYRLGGDIYLQPTGGDYSLSIGRAAGGASSTGAYNVFVGPGAGGNNSTGQLNCYIGPFSGLNASTGGGNCGIGYGAGLNVGGGEYNIFFGPYSGYNNAGNNNLFIGTQSGLTNTTGSGNVFIGFKAGYNETGSNKLYITNSDTATPLIYGDFSTSTLKINTADAATTTVTNTLTLAHNTSNTAAAGFGTGLLFNLKSSTTADQTAAAIDVAWTNATHASRASGIKMQPVSSGGLVNALFVGPTELVVNDDQGNYDFRVEGDTSGYVLLVDASADAVGIGTQTPATRLHVQVTDARTNDRANILTVEHNTTGTAAAGFASGVLFQLESDTTTSQDAALIEAAWTTATHASRTGRLALYGSYTGTLYEGVRVGAVSGAAALGFYGVPAIARPTTSSAAASFTANSGTAVNDTSTFDGYTLKQIVKALRDIGILT